MAMKPRKLKVEYFDKDILLAIIEVDYATDSIKVTNFTDNVLDKPFGNLEPTIDDLDDFFEEHIFDRNRFDMKELLAVRGLDFYDPEAIARISHGRSSDNTYWMRFDDEDITWDELKDKKYIFE